VYSHVKIYLLVIKQQLGAITANSVEQLCEGRAFLLCCFTYLPLLNKDNLLKLNSSALLLQS
jgi:hypothetical protein